MSEPLILDDPTLSQHLSGSKPLVLLVTAGDGLRGDFAAAFKDAAAKSNGDIVFARIDPGQNPQAAERFGTGERPVLIGFVGGEEVVRRARPWGTDMPLLVEELRAKASAAGVSSPAQTEATPPAQQANGVAEPVETKPIDTKPVKVTDATFQAEVIDYHLPVLIDFWAEWCGPCRMVAPALEKLAAEFAGQVRIAKVNTDENPMLSQTFRIMSIPNLMMIKNKTIVFNQPGALPEPTIRDLIQQLIALEVPPPQEQTQAQPAS